TRTHGWRWLRLIKGETTKTTLATDPRANGNNTMMWNITMHAPWPFYAKRALAKPWQASIDDVDIHGVATGVISLPHCGTWDSHPKFLIKGHGDVTLQDGIDGRQITMPTFYPSDGAYMLVDTDPTRQSITTEKTPIDGQVYKYMRNSQLLEILLNDQLEA